ncbi:MAG: DUF3000 domain-containing protein [Actinomycetaceae bacterium]|nr:DUF3000 domain-containing protein [Actinomycetaceae bacterium]
MPQIEAPAEFLTALDSLKGHEFRRELHVTQIPPPAKIAPWAVALQAEVNDSAKLDPESYRGNARFVLLYDPQEQPAWDGRFRIVTYTQAPVDLDMGADSLLGEVAWTWLAESLANHSAAFHNLSGTVTRIQNETFGGLRLASSAIDLEVRASWSPARPDVSAHLLAWAEFAGMICGLVPEDVTSLPRHIEAV